MVRLTVGECRVLAHLAAREGQVVSRGALAEVWGGSARSPERMMDTVIRRLRVKIEPDPERPEHLLTAYGDGYRLVLHRVPPLPLPADADPLFGRDDVVRHLLAALAEPGVVVVTGPPGVGKSRLLLRVAHQLALPGGVLLVDLAPCEDPDQLPTLVARALGVDTGGKRADLAPRLTWAMRERGPMAVVLDEAERLTEAVADLVGSWAGDLELRVLIASRSPVPIAGARHAPLDALDPDAAVELFLHHAARADAPWRSDPEAVARVGPLVDQLDRLPLAVVLAAGRSSALTPSQLADRLADRFRLLAAPRGADPRHRTLRAAVDLSWDLLEPDEQQALASCSVFRGGFDLPAAAAVLNLPPERAERVLSALVARSLVTRHGERFGTYAFVREYAAEVLARDPVAEARAIERHVAWFAAFGAEFDLADAGLSALVADRDNLWAAGERAMSRRLADRVAPAVWALLGVSQADVPVEVTRDVLVRALALPIPRAHRVQLLARLSATELLVGGGEPDAHSAEAAALAREEGDPGLLGQALRVRGYAMSNLGQVLAAVQVLEEAAALTGDAPLRRARVAIALGRALLMSGQLERAREVLAEGERVAREGVHAGVRADLIRFRATIDHRTGRYAEALSLYEEALALFRSTRHPRGVLVALECLVELALELGQAERARSGLDELHAIRRSLGSIEGAAQGANLEGGLARMREDWPAALAHYQDALRQAEALASPQRRAVERVNIGECLLELGRVEEAEVLLAEAVRGLQVGGYRRGLPEARAAWASALAAVGRLDQAAAEIAEAEQQAREAGASAVLAAILARRGLIARARGEDPSGLLAEAEALAAPLPPGAEARRWVRRLRGAR